MNSRSSCLIDSIYAARFFDIFSDNLAAISVNAASGEKEMVVSPPLTKAIYLCHVKMLSQSWIQQYRTPGENQVDQDVCD